MALGLVSLLMDISSEMVHALLPVFLVGTLGASVAAVGLIEGIAEATASVAKLFSGVVSDWFGRRKLLVLLGYGMAAATKPLFPLAGSVGAVLAARFLDRVGKGIRGAPRDALIADVTPMDQRGAAYGLRQSMDTVGAVAGPLLAILLMLATMGDVRLVFWVAVLPALAAVAVIVVGVREPADKPCQTGRRPFPLRRAEMARLPAAYWRTLAVVAVFTLARFSEAFLVLRAQNAGLPAAWVPLVIVVMNLVCAGGAYPLGALADRMDRGRLLGFGIALLVVAGRGACLCAVLARGAGRRRPLGSAYGGHTGVVVGHRRGRCPCRPARQRVRDVQPGAGSGASACQCPGRGSLDSSRAVRDLPGRGSLCTPVAAALACRKGLSRLR